MNQSVNPKSPAPLDEKQLRLLVTKFQSLIEDIKSELQKVIVGQDVVMTRLLMGLFLRGHILLEGVPGLGKTLLLKSLSECLGLEFKRVQCTPDLMPADVIGTRIFQQDGSSVSFVFEQGPVFTNLLLVDEINRATPKTQSALLEAMQECQVTVAGITHPLPQPFMVMASQNPIEMEGTYPLPEAQLDRFLFKLEVPFPSRLELVEIATRTTSPQDIQLTKVIESPEKLLRWTRVIRNLPIARVITDYCARVVLATHPTEDSGIAKKYIRYGASPRGIQALVLAAKARALLVGRTSVIRDDVVDVAQSCLQHRIILNFDAESEGLSPATIIEHILRRLK